MSQRKPANQSWEGFTEQLLQEAQSAGMFDDLPGVGRPLTGLDEADENWWIRRKLQEEEATVLPPLLQARLDIQQTRSLLRDCRREADAREILVQLSRRVWDAIRSPLPSPPVFVLPIDVERELEQWRTDRQSTSKSAHH